MDCLRLTGNILLGFIIWFNFLNIMPNNKLNDGQDKTHTTHTRHTHTHTHTHTQKQAHSSLPSVLPSLTCAYL